MSCYEHSKELGDICVCDEDYVLAHDRNYCQQRTSCDRTEIVSHEEVCMDVPQCPSGYALSTKNGLCVKTCPQLV